MSNCKEHREAIIEELVKQGLNKTEAKNKLKGVKFNRLSRWSYSYATGLPEDLNEYRVYDMINKVFVFKEGGKNEDR